MIPRNRIKLMTPMGETIYVDPTAIMIVSEVNVQHSSGKSLVGLTGQGLQFFVTGKVEEIEAQIFGRLN
jgi:hypothetical protein